MWAGSATYLPLTMKLVCVTNKAKYNKSVGQLIGRSIGFDTGPGLVILINTTGFFSIIDAGNVLIDGLMKILYDKEYDHQGCIGTRGTVNQPLLQHLIDKDLFITKHPPKSTGREVN